jgi:hypothetical protein
MLYMFTVVLSVCILRPHVNFPLPPHPYTCQSHNVRHSWPQTRSAIHICLIAAREETFWLGSILDPEDAGINKVGSKNTFGACMPSTHAGTGQ